MRLETFVLVQTQLSNYPTIQLSNYPTIQLSNYPTSEMSEEPKQKKKKTLVTKEERRAFDRWCKTNAWFTDMLSDEAGPSSLASSSTDPLPSASPAAAAPKPPNIPAYSTILSTFESSLFLNTPGHGDMEWRELDSKVVKDPRLPNGGTVERTIRRWKSVHKPCEKVASREVWEFDDMRGFFFPPLADNGVFVPTKDRVHGRLYRIYVGENRHPRCATKLPTNRFGKHTVTNESKAKKAKNGITHAQCALCVVIFGGESAKGAQYPLLGIKAAVCGKCQTAVGAEKTLVHPCQGSCGKQASYPENADGSGKKKFYCGPCFKKTHGKPPPSQVRGKCDCEKKRVFNDCAICCFACVPPRPVSKSTCVNLVPSKKGGGEEGEDEELVLCNTRIDINHKRLCEQLFPNLDHPLCPSCMHAHAGFKEKLAKREDEWRAEMVVVLKSLMGDDFVAPEDEITFGSQAQKAACLVSASGEDESRSRRVDFLLSLLSFAVVNELDQLGHDAYKCSHNAQWDLLVFQAMQELRGPQYDVYIIRVNPDGKGEGKKRISAAADRGVAVSARTSAEATIKAIAHGKQRAERREKGEHLPGKCFIAHYFYAADSAQLSNEKMLCEQHAFADRFELLQL